MKHMDRKPASIAQPLHPRKPRLAIRVGFAGVRRGFDSELSGLREQFTSILALIKDIVGNLHQSDPLNFERDEPPRLIFVCALAAGADQFAAEIALEAGYELQVPLAMPRATYAQRNFEADEPGLARFNRLIARATSVFELPLAASEEDGYNTAGTVLINHIDVLTAIWDLSESRGRGGTADSVEKARTADIPVVVFSSKEPAPGTIRYRGRTDVRPAELRDIVPAVLYDGLQTETSSTWRPWDRASLDDKQCRSLHAYYKETEQRVDWGFCYDLLVSLILARWKVHFLRPPYERQASENWARLDGERWTDCARQFFRPLDQWADCLAIYYGQWMRGIVALSVVGGGLFVSTALVEKLWPGRFPLPSIAWLEIFPYILFVLILTARIKRVNRRWVECRMLSELLRNHALCAPIGGLHIDRHRFHLRHGFTPTWMRFYYQAAVREFGLCAGVLDDEYLRDYKSLLSARINRQIQYHHAQFATCQTLYVRIRRLGLLAAAVSLLSPILSRWPLWARHLRIPLANLRLEGIESAPFVFAVITASIAGFAAQENFPRLAQVSEVIGKRLSLLWQEVSSAPLNSEKLRTFAGEAIEIAIQEHAGWNASASLREIEMTTG